MADWKEKKALLEQRDEKHAEAAAMVKAAEAAKRNLTPEEKTRFDGLRAEANELNERAERLDFVNGLPGRQSLSQVDEKTQKRYSLLRAINLVLEGKPLDGVEGEMNTEMATRMGKRPQGFFMPDFALQTRTGEMTAAGAGAYSVGTTIGEPILSLRNAMVMSQLGATVLSGLAPGNLQLPAQNATGNGYWVDGETEDVTVSTPTLGAQVTLSPSVLGTFVDMTRKLLGQSTVDAENFARNEVLLSLALELDRACINGSGSGDEPQGILQNSSVPTVAIGAAGGAPTWAKMVELETTVNVANAAAARMAYLTNSKVVGKLKTIPKVATYSATMLMDPDGKTCNGFPVVATNAVPSDLTKSVATALSAAIFGNFADLLIGLWSAVDIMVDPYTGGKAGIVRLVALQDADIQLRRTASFAKCVDFVTT